MLSRKQVGDALRSLGFNETEATEHFQFYEAPYARTRDNNLPAARVQFYVPRSEFKAWLYEPHRPNAAYSGEISEYVDTAEDVIELARQILRERIVRIARAAHAPSDLTEVARHSDEGVRVLLDWCEENGVPTK